MKNPSRRELLRDGFLRKFEQYHRFAAYNWHEAQNDFFFLSLSKIDESVPLAL